VVQLPQRRRPLEDDVAGVAFDARPLAPRRPPTRTDSTVTPRVTALRSDSARGQRESITYGAGATTSTTTTTTYDPQRLWLTRLRTVRAADGAILQDLQYSRDHVGNVIEIDDEAQQTHWFDNAQVSPERTYSYDPLYRLSSATGREKVGLAQAGVLPFPVELLPHGGAANTVLRRYTQSYVYDAAGNLTETVHVAGGSAVWRRRAQVAAGNNQVLASSSGLTGEDTDDPTTWFSQYSHDRRGVMLVLPGEGAPNGMVATRDHRDHLESVALNSADSAHYTHDGAGQRIAKVVDKGQVRHTTLTLWGIEQTTKHNMAATPPVLEEERGTLHIMDDQQRIALVETRTVTTTGTTTTVHGHAPAPLVRFQLGDLLASACVELDGSFGVLGYPEIHPYGTTAWWAEDGALEVSKRYRFTRMERDEETGLKDHNQRYTCPWLGRWDRPDPIGLGDGGNRWAYVKGRVTTGRDESGLEGEEEEQLPRGSGSETIVVREGEKALQLRWGSPKAERAVQQLVVAGLFDDRDQAIQYIAYAGNGHNSVSVVGGGFNLEFRGLTLGRLATGRTGPSNQYLVEAIFGEWEDGDVSLGGFLAAQALSSTPGDWVADLAAAGASAENGDYGMAAVNIAALLPVGEKVQTTVHAVRAAKGVDLSTVLEVAGVPRGFPASVEAQTHHIVPKSEWKGAVAEKLESFGIARDSVENGMWLPKEHFEGRTHALHRGRHTPAYGTAVFNALSKVSNREEALAALQDLRKQLEEGTLQPHYASVTDRVVEEFMNAIR
jgi:RHS repeat-associated protein